MFKLRITPDEGKPYEVNVSTRDVAKWERTNRGASLHQLQSDMKASDVYKIAHIASVRQGLFEGSLKEFEDSVDFEDLDDDEVDPTQPAA